MKKSVLEIFICLILGLCLSKIMYDSYNSKETIKASLNQEKIYLIQIGKFKNKKKMKEKLENINNYIYEKHNDLYYPYVGITQSNVQKLKSFFKKQGYDVYLKQINCNNLEFLNTLNNYDKLLENAKDEKTILEIENQTINNYKEIVVDVKGNTKK